MCGNFKRHHHALPPGHCLGCEQARLRGSLRKSCLWSSVCEMYKQRSIITDGYGALATGWKKKKKGKT